MTSFTWLPDAAWRGALLLAIAFIVARMLKGQPAAVRHVLWTSALAGVMAMPILAVVAPVVPVSIPQRVLQLSSPDTPDNSLGTTDEQARGQRPEAGSLRPQTNMKVLLRPRRPNRPVSVPPFKW